MVGCKHIASVSQRDIKSVLIFQPKFRYKSHPSQVKLYYIIIYIIYTPNGLFNASLLDGDSSGSPPAATILSSCSCCMRVIMWSMIWSVPPDVAAPCAVDAPFVDAGAGIGIVSAIGTAWSSTSLSPENGIHFIISFWLIIMHTYREYPLIIV